MPVLPEGKLGTSFSGVWRDRLAPEYSYRLLGKVLINKNLITQWGGHIIFAFSTVRRLVSGVTLGFPDILGNSSYPIFTKFGMQVYWVNSFYGIAFGDDSSIAN